MSVENKQDRPDERDGNIAPPVMEVRPVGTWVVSVVLLASVLAVWVLVSVIFLHRA
ncbi:hypothetical protein ACLRDC_04985 [Gluconacetobacter sacchari]|uniref:Uncharacterized protein n=2 Tax=Gluconacetobacter sacchari TaxID=92759 RepID=A0A7W4NNU4_9PROT|nr:hypothetical protein [Gluconacetobacter sacchari]MBB2158683.1 hypothetical protein [Gluconacetobacter sacchari]GBQ18993.1 hypothetical protein AA12717_0103 [Gluconacetobacter sacchari DSM 12717]